MFWVKLFAKGCGWCAALISIFMGINAAFREIVDFTIISVFMVLIAVVFDEAIRRCDDDKR